VTHDEKNRRFVVRVGRITRSFMSLAAATSAARDLIMAFGQGNRDVGPREVITKLGGFEVLLDAEVANWLWSTGKWTVRRRSDRALEIRRQRVSDGQPDAEYLTAPRYIYGAGPGERVVFVNGDQLDLRRQPSTRARTTESASGAKSTEGAAEDFGGVQIGARDWKTNGPPDSARSSQAAFYGPIAPARRSDGATWAREFRFGDEKDASK
jgi:hypothetical protein